jgi:hypothetical protein
MLNVYAFASTSSISTEAPSSAIWSRHAHDRARICFLIGHRRENVFVDIGIHREVLTVPVGRPGQGSRLPLSPLL